MHEYGTNSFHNELCFVRIPFSIELYTHNTLVVLAIFQAARNCNADFFLLSRSLDELSRNTFE